MIVEIWSYDSVRLFVYGDPATYGAGVDMLTPADTAGFPHRCFRIADADWRCLRRFGAPEMVEAESRGQTRYRFAPGAAAAVLAAMAPYREPAHAG